MQPNQPQKLNVAERESLKWLFLAEFADGSQIVQDDNDTCHSRTDGTGSAFTDVLEREKEVELVAFHLENMETHEMASVDLKTGAFIVNNTPVHIHDQNFEPANYPLRLIYHRETRVNQNNLVTVADDLSLNMEQVGQARQNVNRYFIGWQTTVAGKNKQVTLAVG